MKKIYSLLLLVVTSMSFGQVFYTENMGVPTGTTLIPAYSTGTAPATFQNGSPISYSGTADMRATAVSSTYTGASGGGNVFFTNTAGRYFQIDGLNTSAYTSANILLSFGYLTGSTTVQIILEYSTNASSATPTWTAIPFTNNTNTSWNLVSIPGGILPSSSTLSLRFTQPTPAAQIRIDDVKLTNFNPACTLALGTPTTACDAVTFGIDTYTATIPYTGGGVGPYVITPSVGTVGGDNPNSVAAGNITILGVPEGTNVSVTITKGSCSFSASANAPECKPVNTLPFTDSFPYTVGNSLNGEQKWSIVNSGDNITIATGNLSYTGITSSGNSVTFTGTGAESRTLFTSTSTGTIFASFIGTVSDMANVTTDLANTYFALFTDNTGASTNARLWIRKNGTQYQYGLGTGSAPTDWASALYNPNDIQYLVLAYDFTNNILSLYVNPTIGGSAAPTISVTPTAPFANLGGFMLRQDTATTTPTMIVDELRIDTTPNFSLGNSSFNAIAGLSISPNPVNNGVFYITTEANAERTVTMFDVLGKQVLNVTTSENAINVAGLNSGVYMVQVTEEGKTSVKKLVIR